MLGLLVVAFVVVPIVELAVILQVGQALGVVNTIGLLILVSVVGAWLVKHEGFGIVRRAQAQMRAGAVPRNEIVDGVIVLGAGALLLTPGFVTDVVGLLLLLPPVRAGVRAYARRRLRVRVQSSVW